MANNIVDEERDFYQTEVSTSRTNKEDLHNDFVVKESGAEGATPDQERVWLILQGVTEGHLNDMWTEFLIGQGYVGALQDMKRQYYIANS